MQHRASYMITLRLARVWGGTGRHWVDNRRASDMPSHSVETARALHGISHIQQRPAPCSGSLQTNPTAFTKT